MRAVIQRANHASVTVSNEVIGKVDEGLVILLGVTHDDSMQDVEYLVQKIANLRIFEDEEGKMNLSIKDINGSVLSISQFTLYADTRKGRRPSFVKAAKPDYANELYEKFNQLLKDEGLHVETGQFGAMMDVRFTNVGPVTIIIDSNDK
ncbi:D-tyrosyl-tRNA(Tyr) deacylase [Cerasibacillus terrae]|uniref:D-aminoacyl-tRNA deacylase n=1 Tax=Cerasibacillus terrae TaxID=2498845 RepID=A0A5C8P3I1_9BACI|nr:D-aminoacyl-tRNA deacylase [Cerasibacillus terrae]TXL68069.1 D-tyrosyl-tRNA(Tyr) deacylase [Cerasibacillus terrae]